MPKVHSCALHRKTDNVTLNKPKTLHKKTKFLRQRNQQCYNKRTKNVASKDLSVVPKEPNGVAPKDKDFTSIDCIKKLPTKLHFLFLQNSVP